MPEHVPMEWGQGGSDRMHHSSRGAEVAVGPRADVFDQRPTFIVRRHSYYLIGRVVTPVTSHPIWTNGPGFKSSKQQLFNAPLFGGNDFTRGESITRQS